MWISRCTNPLFTLLQEVESVVKAGGHSLLSRRSKVLNVGVERNVNHGTDMFRVFRPVAFEPLVAKRSHRLASKGGVSSQHHVRQGISEGDGELPTRILLEQMVAYHLNI